MAFDPNAGSGAIITFANIQQAAIGNEWRLRMASTQPQVSVPSTVARPDAYKAATKISAALAVRSLVNPW